MQRAGRRWVLATVLIGAPACNDIPLPADSGGGMGTTDSATTGGISHSDGLDSDTEPTTDSSSGGDDPFGCGPAPQQGEACRPPVSWDFVDYDVLPPLSLDEYTTWSGPCSVYFIHSEQDDDTRVHDTGLWCDAHAGPDWEIGIRTRVPGTGSHPLRPGDRLDATFVLTDRAGDFALRDAQTGELLMGGLGKVDLMPPREMFDPFVPTARFGVCNFGSLIETGSCDYHQAPFAVEIALDGRSITMFDGQSDSLGGVDFSTRAVEHDMPCFEPCIHFPRWRAAVVLGVGYDAPPPEGCDLFAQDCAAGERCVPVSEQPGVWDATACVPDGRLDAGAECVPTIDGADDCGPDLLCVVDAQSMAGGTCRHRCTGTFDEPECAEGLRCALQSHGDVQPAVCTPICDPLAQDCPTDTDACQYISFDPFEEGFYCMPAGDAELGESCEFVDACVPGLLCAWWEYVAGCEDQGCCAAYCSLSGEPCEQGTCVPFFEEPPPGYEDLGACATAMPG